ncbi:asparaginase [Clostridium scatologenes]|uniref:Asparaginase-related protein n=1 Tax=Clostridium scatologenes TaxID=1548 RepID=A0A0E3JNY5_CLOSL|nr:asparaginase [Clostridium scatologenes]AKA69785.1 asparaginase-related protein [Clostridium scatologenes]
MSEILVNVNRGPIVESLHRGDVAVVNSEGKLLYSIGDPYKVTYMRSAAKPIQTLNVILSGAADKFKFTDEEISIMCASHYGEDFHRKTVEGIMKKIGLSVNDLLCGTTLSLNEEYKNQLIWNHVKLNPTNTDCSGKHAGMLAVCIYNGYDIKGYNLEQHVIQKEIKKVVAEMCNIDEKKIVIGTDGCTVPVYGIALYNMALGFAKLANADNLSIPYKNAANRVFKAMNNAPEMVAGTNGFCTELIKNTHGKLIGKFGAEAVYCIGIKGRDIGIAIKIEDGNSNRALYPVVMQCLEDLNVLDQEEKKALNKFKIIKNLNNIGKSVGEIKPIFHLK